MNLRKIFLITGSVVIGLPVLIVLIAIISYKAVDRTNGVLSVADERRDYLLYVPESYDGTRPVPLVISMHGAALWPASQMRTSRWNEVAEREGFVVVYPAGTGLPRVWDGRSRAVAADVEFISELIDTLQAAYNIDTTQIYANGLSNGGRMAFVLSCRLSHRIAAVGMVAAANELPWSWCEDDGPVPSIAFHGTADPVVPYEGGKSWASPRPFPNILDWTAAWARRNRCSGTPSESRVREDITRREYTDCANDAAVVLYTVHGGGHSWPGGRPMPKWLVGSTSNSVNATAEMWAFFQNYRVRTP